MSSPVWSQNLIAQAAHGINLPLGVSQGGMAQPPWVSQASRGDRRIPG